MFPALVCGNACVFKPGEDVPHTATVFDPSIKGKTDQFVLKFEKPKM